MVGGLAVELARARGARVVGAVREADAGEARRLGAEAVVDTGSDLGRLLREWAPGGLDACLDTIGLGASALDGIRDGGHLITTVPGSAPPETRGIAAQTVQVQPDPAALADLLRRAADGDLTIRIAQSTTWGDYRSAYEMLRGSGLHGKIVLTL
jgi:NADPH:quinone reductase-like Zn-dependent oxidoreductase